MLPLLLYRMGLFWCVDFYIITLVYSSIKICRTILNTYYKAYGFTVIQSESRMFSQFQNVFNSLNLTLNCI